MSTMTIRLILTYGAVILVIRWYLVVKYGICCTSHSNKEVENCWTNRLAYLKDDKKCVAKNGLFFAFYFPTSSGHYLLSWMGHALAEQHIDSYGEIGNLVTNTSACLKDGNKCVANKGQYFAFYFPIKNLCLSSLSIKRKKVQTILWN